MKNAFINRSNWLGILVALVCGAVASLAFALGEADGRSSSTGRASPETTAIASLTEGGSLWLDPWASPETGGDPGLAVLGSLAIAALFGTAFLRAARPARLALIPVCRVRNGPTRGPPSA